MIINKIIHRYKTIPAYVAKMRLLFLMRSLTKRFFTWPAIVKTARGSWIWLGADPVDDIILKDMYQSYRDIYFPETMADISVGVILDVGAHHGIYAMELSSKFPGATVYSFEPDRSALKYLRFNRWLNGRKNVEIIDAALSADSGEAFIVKSDEGSWGNYVATEKPDGDAETIKTISAKDFFSKHQVGQIVFMKLNAEGAEFSILPALFEMKIFPVNLLLFAHPEKGDVPGLIEVLKRQGYSIVKSNEAGPRPWFVLKRS